MRLTAIWFCLIALSYNAVPGSEVRVKEAPIKAVSEDAAESTLGSLVIIGGFERYRDRELWETIVELAGGDGAPIAVFPTASDAPVRYGSKVMQALRRAGAEPFLVPVAWHEVERDVQEAVFDDELVEKVRSAKGIYFIGGAQGRIVDALLDDNGDQTPMLKAIWDVYRRGGVVAGTSAGAAIMSQIMFRDGPTPLKVLRNGVTMGKEIDHGLGFLDHQWFVDQHCLVRGRFARAIVAMNTVGIKLGIGVDENTALIVREGHKAEVIGYRGVLIMDLSDSEKDPNHDGFGLKQIKLSYLDRGDKIDLRTHEVTPSSEKQDDQLLDPSADDYEPYFDHRMFYTDILGNCAVPDLLGRLIDNKESEAIGLAFSGLDSRHEPSEGFEFRFYRGPGSKGWYTEDYGGEDYTVLNIYLDIHPVQVTGPLYQPRIASETSRPRVEPEATSEQE